jgi:hypothetical protein
MQTHRKGHTGRRGVTGRALGRRGAGALGEATSRWAVVLGVLVVAGLLGVLLPARPSWAAPLRCHIGKVFYASGALNPTNACQSCQPATNSKGWCFRYGYAPSKVLQTQGLVNRYLRV